MENLEKIIKYLDGEMLGEEKTSMENDLINEPKLKQTLKFVKDIDEIVGDEDMVNFITKLNQVSSEFQPELKRNFLIISESENSTYNWFIGKKYLLAASIILIVVISSILTYTSSPQNEKLFDEFYAIYDASVITRSDNSETDELVIAIQLYDKKQYVEAIERLNKILKIDANNTAARFFIGVSYMETKEFDKAINNLNKVITIRDTAFLEHAEWYLALCYLKTNNMLQAKTIVNQIKISDSYYRALASDLSKKIN